MSESLAVDVVEDAQRARRLLHPARRALLEALTEPGSAVELARRVGLSRQRANYHLRELEGQHLVELVLERKRGSVVERVYQRTGRAYVISGAVLGNLDSRPEDVQDRFSSAYQVALAARAVRDLGALQAGARAAQKSLPTFALEVEVRFASAAGRNAFAEDFSAALARLVEMHHDEHASGGRVFRIYAGAYPRPTRKTQ